MRVERGRVRVRARSRVRVEHSVVEVVKLAGVFGERHATGMHAPRRSAKKPSAVLAPFESRRLRACNQLHVYMPNLCSARISHALSSARALLRDEKTNGRRCRRADRPGDRHRKQPRRAPGGEVIALDHWGTNAQLLVAEAHQRPERGLRRLERAASRGAGPKARPVREQLVASFERHERRGGAGLTWHRAGRHGAAGAAAGLESLSDRL